MPDTIDGIAGAGERSADLSRAAGTRYSAFEPTLADWASLVRIRTVEETLWDLHRAGQMAGSMHLGIGHEAVAVGIAGALAAHDTLTITYRGHANALARGVSPEGLMAEVLGRATGVCGGRGGSMTIVDARLGLQLSTAIVGGGVPAAVGAALASSRLGTQAVAAAFFGDGATTQGVVYESVQLAALWRLPVVFVCENNLYAEMTPISEMSAVADGIAAAFGTGAGLAALCVDGNDVRATRSAALAALEWARSLRGPVFIEARTYRTCGHYTGDPEQYRPQAEIEAWRDRDPLLLFEAELRRAGLSDGDIQHVRSEVQDEVAAAAKAALAAPPAGREG
jgi:TPP-dependent pyruvate/acetoin dehydrogenase alpha subunit